MWVAFSWNLLAMRYLEQMMEPRSSKIMARTRDEESRDNAYKRFIRIGKGEKDDRESNRKGMGKNGITGEDGF
jgi:hypothetical protein